MEQSLAVPELRHRLQRTAPGRAWLAELDVFLNRFGHRGPMEFDLGIRRWSEDPTMIVELVRSGLAHQGEDLTSRMERLAERRRQAVERAVAASSFWRRPLMRFLARLVELYMPLREAPKHYGLFLFDRARRSALELGRRLAADGVLAGSDDVFFLDLAELRRLARGEAGDGVRELVAARQRQLEEFRAAPAPDFLRSDGVPVEEEAPEMSEDGVLHGTAVSAGRASGPVRILTAPDPRAMRDGDVIVMQLADPGWTPLFPRAAAVVMEVGGLMCHAAVVAREMGIPAVFGVRGARQLLGDGETVTVDGSAGTVEQLQPGE